MPSLRSGAPEVSSPPTGNQPRQARPPRAIAIAAFSSSGSAKNSRASDSTRATNPASTPWPTIEKKPVSRHAVSISRAMPSASADHRAGDTSMTGTGCVGSMACEIDTAFPSGSALVAHQPVETLPGELRGDLRVGGEPVDPALADAELAELLAVAAHREDDVGVQHDLARRDAHVDLVT